MKKDQTTTEKKDQRPPRAKLTKEEVIERMKKFPERKERFLATARTSKD
jgi:hypothetical protein